MIEFLFVLFIFVGLGVRLRRWVRGSDPRRNRLRETRRERERRTGRFPAETVPVHDVAHRTDDESADPFLPSAEE